VLRPAVVPQGSVGGDWYDRALGSLPRRFLAVVLMMDVCSRLAFSGPTKLDLTMFEGVKTQVEDAGPGIPEETSGSQVTSEESGGPGPAASAETPSSEE
jgi:hypothetical protein